MKDRIKNSLYLFLLLFISISGYCQNQGHLIMEITEASSENEQVNAQVQMMKGSVTEVHYKDGQSLTTMNLMGGMVVTRILMEASGDIKLIMDMMGNKMLIPMSKMDIDKAKAENENPMDDLDISYDESDTKEIAGFSCYKMIAQSAVNPDMQIEAYITEEIQANAAVIRGVDLEKFKGFPLEYTLDVGMMTMTTTAKEFLTEVDSDVFNINTDGYTTMTFQKFMDQMGGFGQGFGF